MDTTVYEKLDKESKDILLKMLAKEKLTPSQLASGTYAGYTIDAVSHAKQYSINLDFSEQSIQKVEEILESLNTKFNKGELNKDEVLSFAKRYGGYIGNVIIHHFNGNWLDESDPKAINNGAAIQSSNGQVVFVVSKVYRRITNGFSDNVWAFYCSVSNALKTDELSKGKNEEEVPQAKTKASFWKKIFGI